MQYWRNYKDRGNQSTQRKPCPSATLSTTNPRWKAPGIRPWPQRHDAARKKELAKGLRNEPSVSVTNILLSNDLLLKYALSQTIGSFSWLSLYFFPLRAEFSDFSVRTRGRHGKFHMLAFRYGKHEAAGCIQAITVILIQFKHPDSDRHSEKL